MKKKMYPEAIRLYTESLQYQYVVRATGFPCARVRYGGNSKIE